MSSVFVVSSDEFIQCVGTSLESAVEALKQVYSKYPVTWELMPYDEAYKESVIRATFGSLPGYCIEHVAGFSVREFAVYD